MFQILENHTRYTIYIHFVCIWNNSHVSAIPNTRDRNEGGERDLLCIPHTCESTEYNVSETNYT